MKTHDSLVTAAAQLSLQPLAAILIAPLLLLGTHDACAQAYSLDSAWGVANGTAHLANNSANRGLAYSVLSNQVFVATRNGASSAIDVFDGTTGALLSGAAGVNGAAAVVPDQIGVGDDGVLYAVQLNTALSTSSPLKLYSWTDWNSAPTLIYQSTNASDPVITSFGGKRIGDSMAVAGSGLNTVILLGVGPGVTNFVLLHTSDGVNFSPTVVTNVVTLPGSGGNIFGIAFYTNGTFLVQPPYNATSHNLFLVSYPADFASQGGVTGTVLGSAPAFAGGQNYFMDYSAAGRMLGMAQTMNTSPNPAGIFSMTNFPASIALLASTNFTTPNANINTTGGAILGGQGKTNFLYVLESNNGLQAYRINYTAGAVPPSITSQPLGAAGFAPYTLTASASGTAPLSYQWQASTNNSATANTFTNIPGANTNQYTLNSASTNFYRLVVTNIGGSATSSAVQVSLSSPVSSTVVTQLWRVPAGTSGYAYLGTDNSTRGLAYDTNSSRVIVATVSGGPGLYVLDASYGTNIEAMSLAGATLNGVAGISIDQVVIADDGAVYAGNLAQNGSAFNLNRWDGPFATNNATLAWSGDPDLSAVERWGDNMTIRGAGANTQILLPSRVGTGGGTNVVLFTTSDGLSFTPTTIAITNVPANFAANGVAFGDGNTFWAKTYLGHLYKVAFDPVAQTGGAVLNFANPTQIGTYMVGLGVDPLRNILATIDLGDNPDNLQLMQLTGTADAPVLFHQALLSNNANGNANVAISMKFPKVYALDVNNGLVALTYGVPPTTAPIITSPPASQTAYTNDPAVTFSVGVSGSLPLYYQWRFNGTEIPGATERTYTLSYPPLSASGNYDVVVHNIAGTVTSAPPAVLTVITPVSSIVVTQLWTLAPGSRPYLDNFSYNTRGLAYDTNTATVLLCDHQNIYVLAATNGSDLFQLNTAGLPTGGYNGWVLNQVAAADDGVVYGCNLGGTVAGYSNAFNIVSWSGVSPSAALNYAYGGPTGDDPGAGAGERWGDTLTARGAGVGTELLAGSYNGTNVALFTSADGTTFTSTLIKVAGVPAGFAGQGIAFGASNTFWAKSPSYNLRQVAYDATAGTGTVIQVFTAGTQIVSSFGGISVDPSANVLTGVCFSDTPNDLQLYLLSGNATPPALVQQAFFPGNNINSQLNAASAAKAGRAFGLNANNGIVALSYGIPPTPPATIVNVSFQSGTGSTIIWQTFTGRNYQVEYKNVLSDSAWTVIGPIITGSGNTASYTDTTAPASGRFYRVRSL